MKINYKFAVVIISNYGELRYGRESTISSW